jgi:hypothetical protein
MRDPELVMRAQRAAAELEQAWDRWRTIHGQGTEPLPPVSSYVGYSLEEPWGQPRVVFGIDAREAEQLAALLDRHDVGPIYAAVASRPGARPADEADGRPPESNNGRVHVPTQAQAGAAQHDPASRDKATDPAPPQALRTSFGPPGRRDSTEPALRPATDAETPGPDPRGPEANGEAPAARDAQGAGNAGLVAFRPRREPAPREEEGQEPDVRGEPGGVADDDQPTATWTRASRAPGGHALPRQKRGGAAKSSGSKQEAKDRAGLDTMAADLAGWTAGELPGQASHRCPPGQICDQGPTSLG